MGTLTVGESIYVQLVYGLTELDSPKQENISLLECTVTSQTW